MSFDGNIIEIERVGGEIGYGRFCFVIQPFDGGKFDKRYEDVYKPAIIAAGLDVYRVDADESAQVPIDTIEDKIQATTVCMADITLNN